MLYVTGDLIKKNVKFTDNSIISMTDIINIKGDIFNEMFE